MDKTVSLGQVGAFVVSRDFRKLALEARLNMKSPIANFLRSFPDDFHVTSDRSGRATVKVLRDRI